jgi:hypothetical protein
LLFVGVLFSAGGLLPLSAVLWEVHQDRQITRVEDMGLASDLLWLGGSQDHWLVRSPTLGVFSLRMEREGLAMTPDANLVRKTAVSGKRWVCDATLTHCIPSANESAALVASSRHTSGTDSPASTRLSASMIWLSENLDFFM